MGVMARMSRTTMSRALLSSATRAHSTARSTTSAARAVGSLLIAAMFKGPPSAVEIPDRRAGAMSTRTCEGCSPLVTSRPGKVRPDGFVGQAFQPDASTGQARQAGKPDLRAAEHDNDT